MLKLKIGTNYLISSNPDDKNHIIYNAIPFMMGNFKHKNKICVCINNFNEDIQKIFTAIEEVNIKDFYILRYYDLKDKMSDLTKKQTIELLKDANTLLLKKFKEHNNNWNPKVILLNKYILTKEFGNSRNLMSALANNEKSILFNLKDLDTYKSINKRYNNIPKELKVIDDEIKSLSKKLAPCSRLATFEDIKCLNLIDKYTVDECGNLDLELNELPIYTSENLGEVFDKQAYENNIYLYNATKYIYLGNHFKMPKTHIKITGDGRYGLKFIETLDHKFDRMFAYNNWSGIGYPHFGDKGFCAGEFNDTMVRAKQYGLEYYFISLKQYLTTANVRDSAGYRIWWYPIYNDKEEMVYCAGLDILINEYIKDYNKLFYEELLNMSWEEKAEALKDIFYTNGKVADFKSTHYSYNSHNGDNFLKQCLEKDPVLYEQIKLKRGL